MDFDAKIEFGPKHEDAWGSWRRDVTVAGRKYRIGVNRGQRVRLAYSAKFGFHWSGWVIDAERGERLWDGAIDKSTGVARMLEAAGVYWRLRRWKDELDNAFSNIAYGARRGMEHAAAPPPRLGRFGFSDGGPDCRCDHCDARRRAVYNFGPIVTKKPEETTHA